jgi:hypothetical protein
MGVETTELTAEHLIVSRPASAPCRIERLTLRVLQCGDLERLPQLRTTGPRFGRQRFVVCESVSEDWKAPFDHLLGRGERKAEVAGKLTDRAGDNEDVAIGQRSREGDVVGHRRARQQVECPTGFRTA